MGAGAWVLQSTIELDESATGAEAALAPLRRLVQVSRDRRADRVLVGHATADEVALDGFVPTAG